MMQSLMIDFWVCPEPLRAQVLGPQNGGVLYCTMSLEGLQNYHLTIYLASEATSEVHYRETEEAAPLLLPTGREFYEKIVIQNGLNGSRFYGDQSIYTIKSHYVPNIDIVAY